jgi:hypothetical protein
MSVSSWLSKRPRTESDPVPTVSNNNFARELATPTDISQTIEQNAVQLKKSTYPISMINGHKRSFQSAWFKERPWLEYSQITNSAYCFVCRHFGAGSSDKTWTFSGFSDWKKALEKMNVHSQSHSHRFSSEKYAGWLQARSRGTVVEQLDNSQKLLIEKNRRYLSSILDVIFLCGAQGIALRGNEESTTFNDNLHIEDQNSGNFLAIVKLLAKNNVELAEKLADGPANSKYLCPNIQNSLISCTSEIIGREISSRVQGYYSIICDESRDLSRTEQLSVCVRYLDTSKVEPVEDFLCFVPLQELDAQSLAEQILTVLSDRNLPHDRCIAQCFDGASVMSGKHNGVQKIIRDSIESCIYVHCAAHKINLVLTDLCRFTAKVADLFETLQMLYVFLSSSVVNSVFVKFQEELYPGRQVLRLPK